MFTQCWGKQGTRSFPDAQQTSPSRATSPLLFLVFTISVAQAGLSFLGSDIIGVHYHMELVCTPPPFHEFPSPELRVFLTVSLFASATVLPLPSCLLSGHACRTLPPPLLQHVVGRSGLPTRPIHKTQDADETSSFTLFLKVQKHLQPHETQTGLI